MTFLDSKQPPAEQWRALRERIELEPYYRLIQEVYEGRTAKRSGLPYINHIHEGVFIYFRLFGWEERPIAAYCVHPIFQSDGLLIDATRGTIKMGALEREVIVLAMEYRRVANAYTSKMDTQSQEMIELSPIQEVNRMLAADKIQNTKDFLTHLVDGEAQSSQRQDIAHLTRYFTLWLERLNVSQENYERVVCEVRDAFD